MKIASKKTQQIRIIMGQSLGYSKANFVHFSWNYTYYHLQWILVKGNIFNYSGDSKWHTIDTVIKWEAKVAWLQKKMFDLENGRLFFMDIVHNCTSYNGEYLSCQRFQFMTSQKETIHSFKNKGPRAVTDGTMHHVFPHPIFVPSLSH